MEVCIEDLLQPRRSWCQPEEQDRDRVVTIVAITNRPAIPKHHRQDDRDIKWRNSIKATVSPRYVAQMPTEDAVPHHSGADTSAVAMVSLRARIVSAPIARRAIRPKSKPSLRSSALWARGGKWGKQRRANEDKYDCANGDKK